MKSSNFLTVEEVALNLKVTRQTVAKYINNQKLNAIKINKNYRVTFEDFENFLSENSTAYEPRVKYLKKTKNCTLNYESKTDEFEILNTYPEGEIRILEKNHNNAENEFIYGDNLLILKKLRENYLGKIDLIYIDPPFGTGQEFNSINDDAAYSDKIIDSEFLEFLRKRLFILKELMSEQ